MILFSVSYFEKLAITLACCKGDFIVILNKKHKLMGAVEIVFNVLFVLFSFENTEITSVVKLIGA